MSTPERTPVKNLTFQIIAQSDKQARRGILTFTSKKQVETPNLTVYTRKGSPPNLTPDILDQFTEASLLQISFPDLYVLLHYLSSKVLGC